MNIRKKITYLQYKKLKQDYGISGVLLSGFHVETQAREFIFKT